ncbi:MAG: cell wall-binding protein, partial [Syntrophomonadaceae bacterium]|nr:cell wall-binding protein [Syntrophomonadaceae bacterium]
MKKRLVSIFLLVTMLFAFLPAEAMALMADNANAIQEKIKPENPFVDVQKGSWYYDAVQYSHLNGFFSGTSTNTFDPDGTMNRGMFVTVLGRMAGVDQTAYKGQSAFSDVAEDAYYAPFVAWASKHGITAGVGNGKFDPNGLITREQMAVFFVRYFEAFNVNFDTEANITTVPEDLDTISPWAREMVLKLWKSDLLSGDGTSFNPAGNASRAQAASLCMRTDKAVETWFSEPGIPFNRVSVNPDAEQEPKATDSPTGDESNTEDSGSANKTGGSSGGSKTIYYKVTFVSDSAMEERVYPKDTLLSTLPVPAQPAGKVFLGWYYDDTYSTSVNGKDKLTRNTTLYAKFVDATKLEEGGAPTFVSALEQMPNFSIAVKKADSAPILGTDFKFRNITAPDKTPEVVEAEDMANTETVEVKGVDGVWTISSASEGFTPGHTYQIELISDAVTYDDNTAAIVDFIAAHGQENVAGIRFFNFSIEKDGTLNLKLNDGIKYIDAKVLNPADRASLLEYAGLYVASTDSQGVTTYTANNGSGSFTYTGSDIQAGDIVSVYTGTKPTERKPEKVTTNKTENDDVSYVKITRIENSTYYYVAAEAEDVLFTPDVLPIDVDINDGTTDWKLGGTWVAIDNSKLDFSALQYESMGLSAETTVDVGDFLAFYEGDFGAANAQDIAYGEITAITVNENGTTTITYIEVSKNKVMSAMDLYDETQLTEDELQEIVNENKDEIHRIIEAQLMESDFFDDAGEYLAELALQTDEVKEVFGDGLTMSDCTITYADGIPLGAHDLALMGNIIDNDQDGKKPKVSISISPRLSHFDQNLAGTGLRAEVAVSYKFKIQKKGNNNIMEVELTAFFEQEFTIGFNVSGGAIWKWKWIFPYISDYRMTGNLDLGTYTGLGITATAKLTQAKDNWGMPWPDNARQAEATKKIFSLSQSIKELMKEVDKYLPEEEATGSGGLAEKYSKFMEDANEEWVDLISANLLNLHSAVDPLHILAYGLQVDFVVSANLNVAIGMTFQYENFKRHTFTLLVSSKKGESNTIDLSTNGYQFDFYVMGTIGIRAGIRTKVTVGLFSTKLAGIGLQFEAGFYARMWGYFYYHLENYKIKGEWQKSSGYSGALLIEIGAYLDVKFIAEALNGKYSYAPSIYVKEWPLWSAGQRENVYDFAYEDDPTYSILNVNTYTLPKTIFDMYWMDLKSGELDEGFGNKIKNFDSNTAPNGDDEARFVVEMSNPNFTYNPVNNQITVNTTSGELTQSCEMEITWKDAPMSVSEVLSRTITLNWSNEANAATIVFESNGGSAVQMLRLLAGTAISDKMPAPPARLGYTFAGWYTDSTLNNSFTATTMPKGNTTLYAKWTPNTVSYTVEHYQRALDGQYILVNTDTTPTGKVDTQTAAVAKSYTGFMAQSVKQQLIAPDGTTRVAIYYDRNSYDLKFVYANGNNDITVKVPYGSDIVKPSPPIKQGYTFAGWNSDIPVTMPANALTFTAQWTANTDTLYTVEHKKQNLDGSYTLEQTEEMSGITGQSTNAAAKTYIGFTAQTVEQQTITSDGNTVVEILYDRNSHDLSWNVNGGNSLTGSFTSGNVKYGTSIVKPSTPTRAGYTFTGWYKDAELTTALEDNSTMPDKALTLTAKWTLNAEATYNVKHFKQNLDGTHTLELTEEMSGISGLDTNAMAKTYEGFTAQDFFQQVINEDSTTVVEIYYERNSHLLSWNVNGGNPLSGTYTTGNVKYGTPIVKPSTPTSTRYTFIGWYKDAELTVALEDNSTMPDKALILTAKWTLNAETTYNVKHFKQNLDGTHTLELTEEMSGIAGQDTNAMAKT